MNEQPLKPTPLQAQALEEIKKFLQDKTKQVFILKGYAGTGKTTLIKFLLDYLKETRQNYLLAAPTGRATKVLSEKLGLMTQNEFNPQSIAPFMIDDIIFDTGFYTKPRPVETIHRTIYEFKKVKINPETLFDGLEGFDDHVEYDRDDFKLQFVLKVREDEGVIIIDEASMVSDVESYDTSSALFGSGKTLTDLFSALRRYKFIFIGDPAQLPPVNQNISPALSPQYLKKIHGKNSQEFFLDQILRMNKKNPVIQIAHFLRWQSENHSDPLPRSFYLAGPKNIHVLEYNQFLRFYIGQLVTEYQDKGIEGIAQFIDNNIMLAPSNKYVNTLNQIIRTHLYAYQKNKFGSRIPSLQVGDILLITHNNYLYNLFNGDLVQVIEIDPFHEKKYGFGFQSLTVKRLNDHKKTRIRMFEHIPFSGKPNLLENDRKKLAHQILKEFYAQYKKKNNKKPTQKDISEHMINNHYLNAVQATFGFAITAHKAQGGEWNNVFISNLSLLTWKKYSKPYNWLYTAVTRAREKVFVEYHPAVKPFNKRPGMIN